MQLPAVQDLANEFSIIVREQLTSEQCREVDNANEHNNAAICASHDFCDANQAMIDALERFNVQFDPHDIDQCDLINAAWTFARTQRFSGA